MNERLPHLPLSITHAQNLAIEALSHFKMFVEWGTIQSVISRGACQ